MTDPVAGIADTRGHYRPQRSLYADDLTHFLARSPESILGLLAGATGFPVTLEQRFAWTEQIGLLRDALSGLEGRGRIYFEYAIPRLGKWIDVLLVLDHVVFVIEFKVGEAAFNRAAIDQVWDYALDLRNFHETSHGIPIAPMLVATKAKPLILGVVLRANDPLMPEPVCAGATQIRAAITHILELLTGPRLDADAWERGRYQPTPTIIEAARALYAGHSVDDISRSDAGAVNLTRTSAVIDRIIRDARVEGRKAICFVTGVPGAGKTLVGLDVATKHRDKNALHSVFLSGNGPLVAVLREALARDHVQRELAQGRKVTKGDARRLVSAFIQNVHHFRDECLIDPSQPPVDHVTLFDEAQRAWDRAQTSFLMRRKKNQPDFDQSEPEFLIPFAATTRQRIPGGGRRRSIVTRLNSSAPWRKVCHQFVGHPLQTARSPSCKYKLHAGWLKNVIFGNWLRCSALHKDLPIELRPQVPDYTVLASGLARSPASRLIDVGCMTGRNPINQFERCSLRHYQEIQRTQNPTFAVLLDSNGAIAWRTHALHEPCGAKPVTGLCTWIALVSHAPETHTRSVRLIRDQTGFPRFTRAKQVTSTNCGRAMTAPRSLVQKIHKIVPGLYDSYLRPS